MVLLADGKFAEAKKLAGPGPGKRPSPPETT
jgi:hypothetical protein